MADRKKVKRSNQREVAPSKRVRTKDGTTKQTSIIAGWSKNISAVLLLFVGFFFLQQHYWQHASESSLPVVEFLSAASGGPPEPLEQQSADPAFLLLNGSFFKSFLRCCR